MVYKNELKFIEAVDEFAAVVHEFRCWLGYLYYEDDTISELELLTRLRKERTLEGIISKLDEYPSQEVSLELTITLIDNLKYEKALQPVWRLVEIVPLYGYIKLLKDLFNDDKNLDHLIKLKLDVYEDLDDHNGSLQAYCDDYKYNILELVEENTNLKYYLIEGYDPYDNDKLLGGLWSDRDQEMVHYIDEETMLDTDLLYDWYNTKR